MMKDENKDENKLKIIFVISGIFMIVSVIISDFNASLALILMSTSAFWFGYSNGALEVKRENENLIIVLMRDVRMLKNKLKRLEKKTG